MGEDQRRHVEGEIRHWLVGLVGWLVAGGWSGRARAAFFLWPATCDRSRRAFLLQVHAENSPGLMLVSPLARRDLLGWDLARFQIA